MLKKSRYGKCIQLFVKNGKPYFIKNKKEIKTRKQRFGKSLIFSNMLDAKIRAFAFCCVVSMTLIRIMQWMTEQEGYTMSTTILKDELTDIQWEIFKLGKIEKQMSRQFNKKELLKVDEAIKVSEEIVNNFYKMSSGQWLKNRYDIKTVKDLVPHECVDGPFAQVVKYERQKKDVPLGSSLFSLYKICLQDNAILIMVSKKDNLLLEPFLLYILTHELVHVVRFSKFKQRYENRNEADVTLDEERKVHQLTHTILKPVSVHGLSKVFEFYKDWCKEPEI